MEHQESSNRSVAIATPRQSNRTVNFLSKIEILTRMIVPLPSTGQVRAILCQRGFSTLEYFQSPMVKLDSCRIPQLTEKGLMFSTCWIPVQSYRCRMMKGDVSGHLGHTATNEMNGFLSSICTPLAMKLLPSSSDIVAKLVNARSGRALETI